MRILAISDIHHNIESVRRLRWIETNRFDAVVVAGDFGSESAAEILAICNSFDCPVLYVFGNWDADCSYDGQAFSPARHIQDNAIIVDGFCFVGFSGCYIDWGRNPVAESVSQQLRRTHKDVVDQLEEIENLKIAPSKKKAKKQKLFMSAQGLAYKFDNEKFHRHVSSECIEHAMRLWRRTNVAREKTIFVSHAREFRIHEKFLDLGSYLFGHSHGFRDTLYHGTRFINVSVMDLPILVEHVSGPLNGFEDNFGSKAPHFNYGTYTVLEYSSYGDLDAQSHRLWQDDSQFKRLPIVNSGGATVHNKDELWSG